MTRSRASLVVIIGFTVALVCGPLLSVLAGPTAGGFHWARQQPQFTLQVGDNVDGVWDRILQRAVADWNNGETVTFHIVSGGANPQECRPTPGRVEVCNWRYGTQEGWLGLTRLYFDDSGEHIDSATVQMNDSFFDTGSEYNNDAARQHTMCHEMGHTPGLDHDVSTRSCMNDSQYAVFNYLVPITKDFNQLARIYRHSDATTTVAGGLEPVTKDKPKNDKKDTPKKGTGGKKDRKGRRDGRWGRHQHASGERIDSAGNASETVTIETLADGRTVVSFITWAQNPAS